MAGKVTFVNKSNTGQSFKLNLFGSAKNCVKVSNLLAVFKASVVVMADGSLMEADDDGLSVDTFKPGSTHIITIVPAQGQGQLLLPCFLLLLFLSMAFHCRLQIPSIFYLCFLNKGLEITVLPPHSPLVDCLTEPAHFAFHFCHCRLQSLSTFYLHFLNKGSGGHRFFCPPLCGLSYRANTACSAASSSRSIGYSTSAMLGY